MPKLKKKAILNPDEAVKVAKSLLMDDFKEHLIGIYLDTQNVMLKVELISLGTLTASLVHPREVFRPALVNHSAGMLLLHNHPSGNTEPSQEDITTTTRLKKAGEILGIEFIDHIIFTKKEKVSFKEIGYIK